MTNIYDLISDLYTDDDGWNQVLRREYAEGFMRREAFRGGSDDELMDTWSQIMYLLIYCGNSDCHIGDLSGEDFIYCISWCQRNIGDFELNYANVEKFLSVCGRLLQYLKQKKAVTQDTAAAACARKLLGADGRLLLFDADGYLPAEYESRRINAEPDLEMKVFVQLGRRMNELFTLLREHFQRGVFQYDRERARISFFGMEEIPDLEEQSDLFAAFWEYFAFDYHLMESGQRPIEAFYEYYREHPDARYADSNHMLLQLLETLQDARLMIFTIEAQTADGWFSCKDFVTGNLLELSLPVEDGMDYRSFLCSAHVLGDGNLVTEYLRSVTVGALARRALRNNFRHLLEWYRIAHPGADWLAFCQENGALVNHAVAYAGFEESVLEAFRWTTDITAYEPAPPVRKNRVCEYISMLYQHLHLPYRDRKNLDRMWNDFYSRSPIACMQDEDFLLWSVALLGAYMEANATLFFDMDHYIRSMQFDRKKIEEKITHIQNTLALEEFDPRYVNEEAMISMILT